jgi:putative addiction module component (TIGR02574 family)
MFLFALTTGFGRSPMSVNMKSLAIDRLTVPERILLIEEIWDSIAANEENLPLTEVQRAELDRRLAACEADPDAGSNREDVKARVWNQP